MTAAGPCVMEGVELSSENVERAVSDHYHPHHHYHYHHYCHHQVLQFYQTGAASQQTLQETHKWLTLAQLSPQVSCH